MDVYNQRKVLLLTPIMPAETGNGLAMRAGVQLRALSDLCDVHVVVVPVAGGSADTSWPERHGASVSVVLPDADDVRAGATRLMADPVWRERFQRSAPFPRAVTYAGPALAAAVVAAAGAEGARVHALRIYLAPLAVAVAELLGAPPATIDLDDDDEHLMDAEGRHEEARAYGRILTTFGGEFRWLSLASAEDAARIADRHGVPTTVVPNAVTVPPGIAGRSRANGGRRTLLLVGNLTYAPNVEAAEQLVREILPRVRTLVGGEVTVELAGVFEPGGPIEGLRSAGGVEVRGYVDDLAGAYARADVAVVPLARGAGTRIKLLEALAAGVPAVTTTAGAAGLAAENERHLLIADDADGLAAAVARVLLDEELASALVRDGRAFVEQRFSTAVVSERLRALMPELDGPGGSRDQLPRRQV